MSFSIDGETWTPKTTSKHATELMTKINALLQENNVTDDSGNVIQLSQNFANALYLLVLGSSSKFEENDAKLSAAINSFNIELCDDAQIENLLPIAAMTRNPGSYSTLTLTVTAATTGDAIIPAGTRAPYGEFFFVTKTDALIEAGTHQEIETVCDTLGPVAVLTGEVKSFENTIANVESVENLVSSVPGTSPETTNELRQRLINGDTIKYSLNGCKLSLEELTGVSYARVYFNYNATEDIEISGGVTIPPRHAYIVIKGDSDKIAEVYSEYMNAPTMNAEGSDGTKGTMVIKVTAEGTAAATIPTGATVSDNGIKWVVQTQTQVPAGTTVEINTQCEKVGEIEVEAGAIEEFDTPITNVNSVTNLAAEPGTDKTADSQNFITQSGQSIPVLFDHAKKQYVYVRIWLEAEADSDVQVENQLRRDMLVASAGWTIGEKITALVTAKPYVNCAYTTVAYTEVSLDGEEWTTHLEIPGNVIPAVKDATIIVEQLDE